MPESNVATKRAAQETTNSVGHVLAHTHQDTHNVTPERTSKEYYRSQPSLEAIRLAITNARRYNFIAR